MHSSADMSFLAIPNQEGLFKTIKTSKSEAEGPSRTDAAEENNDEEEEEDDDDTDDVRFIPRCSPVPRKRGLSIFEETAEYIRIHQALSPGKRVSFADTTGGDLVDVREFTDFDSDEEDSAKWQEEEAKYRKAEREPTYRVHPEFHFPSGSFLLQAVRSNKVEVERITPLEEEPLSFSGVIRVLNISFHKAVYIRSTMDSWCTYFDHPAEYMFGSNDGDTDQFSFKLSFAPPYTTHGSRIEFVVRYETSVGDYWANNFSMNYAVTLHLSYEDDPAQASTDMAQKRSILKSPKVYSLTSEEDQGKEEAEEPESLPAELVRPSPVCPVIIHPEIDVEKPVHQSGSSATSQHGPPSGGATLSTPAAPSASSEPNPQSNSTFALQPDKSQPSHLLHQEHESQTPEQFVCSLPTASPSPSHSSSQETEQRSDESQSERVETLPRVSPPAARTLSAAGDKHVAAAECVSCPSPRDEITFKISHLQKRLLEISTKSAERQRNRRAAAETCASLKAEDEGRPSAYSAPHSASFNDPLGLMSEEDYSMDLIPCIIFMEFPSHRCGGNSLAKSREADQ